MHARQILYQLSHIPSLSPHLKVKKVEAKGSCCLVSKVQGFCVTLETESLGSSCWE